MANKIPCTYYGILKPINSQEYVKESKQEAFKRRLEEADFDFEACQGCGSVNIVLSAVYRDTPHPDQIQVLMAKTICIDCHAVEDATPISAHEDGTIWAEESGDSMIEKMLFNKDCTLMQREMDTCPHACCNNGACTLEWCLEC